MEGRDLGREGASDGAGPAPSKRVVILVGPCGSGKSTFAHELMSRAPGWVRVCQDSIGKGGRRGSRAQCVKALRQALAEGKSVLVDRCHVTPEQRREFVGVARDDPGVTAIDAVVFDFPLQVLQHRVKYRINHEGGVEGPRGAIVCATMRKQLMVRSNQPSLHEGFSSIHWVRDEVDKDGVLGTLVRGSSAAVGEKRARPQAEAREEGDCSGAKPQEGEKKAKKTEVIVIDD